MAKKEIKTQTIEEILADHTPTSEAVKSAVQRYNEERKKKQEQIIIDTLEKMDLKYPELPAQEAAKLDEAKKMLENE